MSKSFLFALALTATASSSVGAFAPCSDGQAELTVEMSVERNINIYCVAEPICVAENSNGSCPGPQEGLPFGSYCGIVDSGVYGCKELGADSAPIASPSETPSPSSSGEGSTTPTSAPILDFSSGSAQESATVNVTTELSPILTNSGECPPGQIDMSVQGVDGSFCVEGPSCVADNVSGACPEAQSGLLYGSYCALIETGVYGCKPYSGVNQLSQVTYEAPLDCTGNPAGDLPVSIVGATRAYCAASPVCSGSIVGNCPKTQQGLLQDSQCAVVATGVFGCVFVTNP
ncbi:hypothetical protein BBJ28_00002033 [Nothophytophthora sp. Chile5]|nr:hypothetical protein BBJ28_00002033 [Nothophytophthora sp. Chile5]